MRKLFSLIAAVLFAGSMMADSYTISFKDAGEGKGDSSTSLTSTTVADYVAEGAEYVSAVSASGKVYNGQTGYGLKFGNSSNPGSITLTLATAVTPTSIVMNASPWSATEGAGLLQDAVYETKSTGAKGTFADFAYEYDGATEVTTIIVGTSTKRGYVKSITVYYGGEVVPPSMDYYVVGSMTSWAANASYKLKANAAQEGEYMADFTFAANDEFKVAYSDGKTIDDANWFPTGMNNNYVISEAGDYTVYFRPAGGVDGWHYGFINAVKKEAPELTDPTNCAEAATAALSVSTNNEEYNGGKEYTIEGYVTEIAYAYDATKGNMSFWMADTKDGGKVLEAYKCTITSEENAPAVGDKVAVTGKLTKYNTTPEFAEGCTVEIIEKAGGDTPGGGDDPVLVMTCAEAVAAAQAGSTQKATVRGYVTEIAYAWKNGSMSFWMADSKDGGKVFEAYKCECAEADAPVVGDLVEATGNLTMYNTTAELAAGCTVVIIEKGEGGGDDPVVTDPTNCAEAREAALSVSANNELYNGGKEYTIEGYVTAIQTAFNPTYKQVSFWMADTEDGGNVLQAYRAVCESAADAPAVGDKVAVTGKLTKYNTTPEFAQGCTYVITEKTTNLPVNLGPKTIAEFLELKNTIDTCVISGVVTSITNTSYGNLYLADEKDTVYIYGVLTAEGVSKQFESLNVKVNDTLTVKAVYGEYNNAPQVKDAVFVEVKKAPAQDINVNMSDGLIYSDYVAAEGWWQIYGSNEKFDVSISNDSTGQAEGTYTISDLDADYTYVGVINGNDTNYVSFVDGSVTLSIDAQTGNVTVAGTLVGDDGNNYILNLQFIVPTPQETVNVNIQNAELIDYYADYGLYGVSGTDANDISVQIAIWTETFEGNFTETDLDVQYIGSAIFEGEEQVNIYTASITVTPGNNGSYNIEATILGYNNKQYNVTMTIPASEPTGIEETLATGKAVKVLRNGQLLIMKGEKTFDVMGARIR